MLSQTSTAAVTDISSDEGRGPRRCQRGTRAARTMPRAPLPRKAPATPSGHAWVVAGAECATTEEAARRNETTASQIPAGVVRWCAAQPSSATAQTADPAPNAVADRAEKRGLRRAVARRSTAAATKTSSMFCFTAAAATASAPAAIHHQMAPRVDLY